MDDAVADRVCDGRIAEEVVPAIVLELAGDDRRAQAVAVLQDLEQVMPSLLGERRESEVIEDENVDLGDAGEETLVAAVSVREA